MDTGVILLLVIIALGVFLVMVYNRLVALRQTCNQAWGDIDVQLKQRHDLVPNLVSTVQGYASHEKETLENVIKARQTAIDATSVKDLAGAENMLSGALRQLFALSEAYPDLKANQNFMQLQAELSDLENKIAAARRFFNNAVNEYNTSTEQFPAVVIANSMGFKMREYFEVGEAERGAPKVQF
ncbi:MULTISPECIES: LemA family protein [Maricaulis]|jgi:LemA protein|uniref:LemA family protein n=1 Tax=Maricaulis maris (strain MCS10) TaxID=394221 RepID=Q0APC9_MARMM|nr:MULTISPECIES: LemA family protein [Maricaulis]ABI65858.1 LemA family protein [Maricaulis maris MCS10]MAC90642.1 LemA family protein [Maricaulis sp.]